MEAGNDVAERDLPKLKSLASDLLGAEAPDPAALEEMAALAASLAAYCREQSRQELLGEVLETARTILPGAVGDLRSYLAQLSRAELSSLGSLLDGANEARAAFACADSELMTARERGDYGAMVPFVLEAETQKRAFDTASAEFANRIGFSGSLMPQIASTAAPEPAAPEPAAPAASTETSMPPESPPDPPFLSPDFGAPEAGGMVAWPIEADPTDALADPAAPTESQAGRRRIRDLIRQVRSTSDESLSAR